MGKQLLAILAIALTLGVTFVTLTPDLRITAPTIILFMISCIVLYVIGYAHGLGEER